MYQLRPVYLTETPHQSQQIHVKKENFRADCFVLASTFACAVPEVSESPRVLFVSGWGDYTCVHCADHCLLLYHQISILIGGKNEKVE